MTYETIIQSNNGIKYVFGNENQERKIIFEPAGIEVKIFDDTAQDISIQGKLAFEKQEHPGEYPSIFLLAEVLNHEAITALSTPVLTDKQKIRSRKLKPINQLAGVMLQYTKGAHYSHEPKERDLKIWHMKQKIYKNIEEVYQRGERGLFFSNSGSLGHALAKARIIQYDGYSDEDDGCFYKTAPQFNRLFKGANYREVCKDLQQKCSERDGILKRIDNYMIKNYFAKR